MKQIVFRVDSSLVMGSGHLMRCLTLADELQKKSCQITFICRNLKGNLIKSINHLVLTLPRNNSFQSDDFYLNWLGATQEQDAEQTIKAISENIDLLIVDSYALDEKWHQKLRCHAKTIMLIDDLMNRQFDCDVLLNQNLGIHKKDYRNKVLKGCELLLGCDYALLRPEFSKLREKALVKRKGTQEIKNILISMGGSDIKNITYNILKNISNSYNIVVVLGRESPYNKMLENYAKNKKITIIIDANNMAELMLSADLAIGAGGSTSWERCCLGLPTLLYVTANNQRTIAENLEKIGAVKIVENLNKDLRNMTDNLSLWKSISKNSSKVCDGLGVNRVTKFLQ
jgi:UDP-2,4-diacetamido-2,4,6-trideoxy-beta-L-altropyranose hydrolase